MIRSLVVPMAILAAALAVCHPVAPGRAAAPAQEALERGAVHFQAGRFQEAQAAFQEALAADPNLREAKRGLASTLAALGHRALQSSNWIEAKQLAEKAVELWPEEQDFHFLLAVILFRQGDYSYSRWAVRRALELDPANSPARELLGDILYQEGYLDLAIPEWESAREGSTNGEGLRRKIDKTKAELNVEGDYNRDLSRHFILQTDGPVPKWVAQTVLDSLEDGFDRLRRELGTQPMGDITVILYAGIAFQEVTRSPGWVGGRFDGKVRIPVGGLTSVEEAGSLKPILIHELTHAFLRSIVPQGIAPWLEEGLAEHFEGVDVPSARSWLERNARARFATLGDVDRALRGGGGDVETAYWAAAMAVGTLIKDQSFWTVRRLLEDLGSGQSLEAALRSETRLSLEEFQEMWRRALP